MARNTRLAFAAVALIGLFTAAPLFAEDSDHADHHHQLIRIFEGRVRPAVQTIGATDALGWLNYTSRIARVSFAKDVAKNLTCTSPGSFRIDGERLISGDIQATQFATLCNLAPGEYDYQVTLRSGIGVGQGGEKTIDGKIVVQ